MNANVRSQIALLCERSTTRGTYVRPFTGMCALMNLQKKNSGECSTTIFAGVRLFSGVHSHVNFQIATLDESPVADMTFVWFDAAVSSRMQIQCTTCFECFRTDFTVEWTFVGVCLSGRERGWEWKKKKYFRLFGRCVNASWLTRTCACRSDWAQNDLLQYSHECSFLFPFFRLCLALLSSTSFTLDGCSLIEERFEMYFTSFLSW